MKTPFLFQHSRLLCLQYPGGVDAAVHGGAEEADSDSEDEATDDVEPPKVLGDLLERRQTLILSVLIIALKKV